MGKVLLEPRTCLFCGKQFQPRRGNQKCCDSKCRARLQHNVKLDSFKILHAVNVGTSERPSTYAFTVRIHGFAIKGFFYDQRTGSIKWPRCFLSYGPFYKQPTRGMSIPSKVLQKLVKKWLDSHEKDLLCRKADEDERIKAERLKAVESKEHCPICGGKCERVYEKKSIRCVECDHLVRPLSREEMWSLGIALGLF
jgi:hypothetical protein